MSLVFYDTETTGTETAFDQILQFAAIRTDADLNEIDRFEIRCRLQPHVVPAPGAMLVTKVKTVLLDDMSLPSHYEMVRAVRVKLLAWSPANFIGYNSIAFDEHLLRQALYQTLHYPYLTNSKGNTRTDVMRIVQASAQFEPNALALPFGDKGQRIFKLDKVAPMNGFKHDRAHDAMGDVEATIFLARLLRERAPELWSAAMRFGQKAAALDFIQSERAFCYGEHLYGKPFAWTVTGLGVNEANKSEYLVFDLVIDPATLVDLDERQPGYRVGRSPKPVRSVKVNAAPLFLPFPDAVPATSSRAIDRQVLEERAAFIEENADLRERLIDAFLSAKDEREELPHVEQQIYADFTSDDDMELLDRFHEAPWEQRQDIVAKLKDRRLRELGLRLIFFERPGALDRETRMMLERWNSERLLGGDGVPWLTLEAALQNVEELLNDLDDDERAHLEDHQAWLTDRLCAAKRA